MDGEAIGTLLVIAFWVISGLLNALGKRRKKAQEPEFESLPSEEVPSTAPFPESQTPSLPPPAPAAKPRPSLGPETVGDLLREMLDEVQGKTDRAEPPPVWQEPRVDGEHSQDASERRQAASETGWSRGEHSWSPGEHGGTLGEHRRTRSEHRSTLSEHRVSLGEHRRGDVRPERVLLGGVGKRRRSQNGSAKAVRRALADHRSVANAFVLNEVLGPPVSLRDRSNEGF